MIREDLEAIPSYAAGASTPGTVKLSSNEAAHPPLPAARRAMRDTLAGLNRYPDITSTAVRRALSDRLGLPCEGIAVGCGSSALLQQLVQATCTPNHSVVYPWRSFEAYPIFVQVTGAEARPIPLHADGTHDLAAMLAAIDDTTSLVIACTPNNPTGRTLDAAEFAEFCAALPDAVTLALDEAYIEFDRSAASPDALALLRRRPRQTVVMRTFSKAYGLAGARIGYAFGDPEVIAAINKVAVPFAVNPIAQAGAIAALGAVEELAERVDEVANERDRVADALGVAHTQSNFVWLPAPADDPKYPHRVADALAARGVLVRAFPEGVRVTIGAPKENDALIRAWRSQPFAHV